MQQISRDELRLMLDLDGFQLVEVLPPEDYRDFHLSGAINVPLDDDFDEKIEQAIPDKNRQVVLYSRDAECRTSRNAARRMDQLGYRHVADYEAGKEDWRAAGLPVESSP